MFERFGIPHSHRSNKLVISTPRTIPLKLKKLEEKLKELEEKENN